MTRLLILVMLCGCAAPKRAVYYECANGKCAPLVEKIGHINVIVARGARVRMEDKMKLAEVLGNEEIINKLPMGPMRWKMESELVKQKVACADYICDLQAIPFTQWMVELATASKESGSVWENDQIRHDYYEGQPDVWIQFYDSGASAEDAVIEDMSYWAD